jgi:hypothetical protein
MFIRMQHQYQCYIYVSAFHMHVESTFVVQSTSPVHRSSLAIVDVVQFACINSYEAVTHFICQRPCKQ